MKSKFCFILLSLVLVFSLLVSCNSESKKDDDTSISGNISDLTGKWLTVTDSTTISLKNIPNDVLYNVQVSSSSNNSKSASRDNEKDKLAITENGSIIPIPDENNACSYKGSDIGISGTEGKMRIDTIKSNTTEGLMILSSKNPDQRCEPKDSRYDEYYETSYCINLNSEKFSPLNKTEIAIISKKLGGGGSANMSSDYGIFFTNNYALSNSKKVKSLLDMSDISGFNIYQGFGITKSNPDVWRQFEIVITNPISLPYGEETEIPSENNVFRVTKALDKTKEFVIELKSPERISDTYQNFDDNADARYLDGTRKPYFAPMTNEKKNVATYYLGKIEDDFIFNVCWTGSSETVNYGTLTLREITEEEKNSIVFINKEETDFTIPDEIPYKLFVVEPGITVCSVEYSDLTGATEMEMYYVSGHLNGIGRSGKGEVSSVKKEIRPSDCLEYFYTMRIKEKTNDTSGTVICKFPQTI